MFGRIVRSNEVAKLVREFASDDVRIRDERGVQRDDGLIALLVELATEPRKSAKSNNQRGNNGCSDLLASYAKIGH